MLTCVVLHSSESDIPVEVAGNAADGDRGNSLVDYLITADLHINNFYTVNVACVC